MTPAERKRYPLSLYVTRALKDELAQAAKRSGRALTAEIEARLQRTLDEDRGKDTSQIRLENLATETVQRLFAEIGEQARRCWETGPDRPPPEPVVSKVPAEFLEAARQAREAAPDGPPPQPNIVNPDAALDATEKPEQRPLAKHRRRGAR